MAVLASTITTDEENDGRWHAPLTVTREELLVDGSDRSCQWLIYNLFALSLHMEMCRNVVAKKFGVSGPQYSIFMAIARFQEEHGISAGAVARLLNVSAAFITTETGKLIEQGLLVKQRSPEDRRVVMLKVSPPGEALIDRYAKLISHMNDALFSDLSADEFQALNSVIGRLVKTSARTLDMLRAADERSRSNSKP